MNAHYTISQPGALDHAAMMKMENFGETEEKGTP
jgi:hypothetical protein